MISNASDALSIDFSSPIFNRSPFIIKYGLIKPSDFYHYTDLNGFISIMQNQELWASHISFMNDTSEYLHGKKMFQDELSCRITNGTTQEKALLTEILKSLDNEYSCGFSSISSRDVFSLSFSYSRNSLELWRGYGKRSGIAIGFDFSDFGGNIRLLPTEIYESLLAKCKNPEYIVPDDHEMLFMPISVCYSDDEKKTLVNAIIDSVLQEYNRQIMNGSKIALIGALQSLSDLIFYFIPFFKHPGFIGENECRIISDSFHYISENPYKIHYRERGGVILPYIKLKILDCNCRPLKSFPIREIIVGPGLRQQKTIESVKYFLEKNGFNDLVSKVNASDIPYVEV